MQNPTRRTLVPDSVYKGNDQDRTWTSLKTVLKFKDKDKCMAKKKSSLLSSGKTGASTGAMEYTKGYIKRKRKRMRDEEKIWKSLNGPITVRKIENA